MAAKPDKLSARRETERLYREEMMSRREHGMLNAPVMDEGRFIPLKTPTVFPAERRSRARQTATVIETVRYPAVLLLLNGLALALLAGILLLLMALALSGRVLVLQVY